MSFSPKFPENIVTIFHVLCFCFDNMIFAEVRSKAILSVEFLIVFKLNILSHNEQGSQSSSASYEVQNFWLLRRLPLGVLTLKTTQLMYNTTSSRKLFTGTKFRNSFRPTVPPRLLPHHILNYVFCRLRTCRLPMLHNHTWSFPVYYLLSSQSVCNYSSFSKKFFFLNLKNIQSID